MPSVQGSFQIRIRGAERIKTKDKNIRIIEKRKLSSFDLNIEMKLGKEGLQLICSCFPGETLY